MTSRLVGSLSALLIAAGGVATAAQAPVNWSQFRNGPAHTGFNGFERSLSAANVSRLRRAWTHRTAQPVWSSPAVVNGVVYIGSNTRRVYALRASNGRQIWSVRVGGRPAAPAVSGGTVYVYADDGALYALRADSGRRLWRTFVSGTEGGFPAAATVSGGVVYTMSHDLAAVDRRNGRILWERGLDGFGCPVTVVGQRAYVGTREFRGETNPPTRLLALDARTGAIEWETPIVGLAACTPAVSGGRVFLSSFDNVGGIRTYRLESFDTRDGARQWSAPIGQSRFLTFSAPAVAGSRVVVPSPSGDLYAHDVATGSLLWRTALPVADSAPAIANGVVYVGGGDGNLYAFALKDGRRLWSAKVGGEYVSSSPTVVNGAVYIGSEDGGVIAFRRR